MRLLTRETDYAVRALISAAGDTYKSAGVISRQADIPYGFLRRILGRLREAGYIETREGPRGGVRLIRDPDTISLAELAELFQGEMKLSGCVFRKKICKNTGRCPLRKRLIRTREKVKRDFESITLALLMEESDG